VSRRALLLAHRGDQRRAPENTLAAFRAALAAPACDGLEFDVRRSTDGVPVINHDATLARVQGRPDRVDALTADELAAAGVPTLAAVLGLAPGDAFLDIELKGDPGAAVIPVIEAARGPRLERAVVSSFEPAALERIAAARPGWGRWLNADALDARVIDLALSLGCRGVAAEVGGVDARSVAAASSVGLEVAAWTVRDPDTLRRVVEAGVVAVCAEGDLLDG
jgi:glycerophosphoryl diester phosphodiesterase